MSSFFVERLYCIWIWRTSFALVATYVCYTICSLFRYSRYVRSCHTCVTLLYTLQALLLTIHSYIQYHYDDSTLSITTADYYPSTILRIRGCDCDCADALLQIRGHTFDDSAATLWQFCGLPLAIRGHPLTILWISLTVPQKNCGLPTRWICGFRKVSCDVYHTCSFIHKTYVSNYFVPFVSVFSHFGCLGQRQANGVNVLQLWNAKFLSYSHQHQ